MSGGSTWSEVVFSSPKITQPHLLPVISSDVHIQDDTLWKEKHFLNSFAWYLSYLPSHHFYFPRTVTITEHLISLNISCIKSQSLRC